MSSRTTIADMTNLRDVLDLSRPLDDLLPEQRARLVDWVETAIRVREAQKTRSKTPQHDELMIAYRAAVAQWQATREHETVMHPGDLAIFDEQHPMPRLRDFMVAARAPFRFCPMCGTDLTTTTTERSST